MDASTPPLEPPNTGVTFRGIAFANVTTMLILTGATASLYGPLLLTIAHKFHISLPQAGVVLSVHFLGALAGVPIGWLAMKRYKGSRVVTLMLFIMALGATDVALAKWWGLFLVGVFLVGLGFGGLDFTLNTMLARTALAGRARRLSLANAGYGVGSVIGPLLIIAVRPHNFAVLFAGVAVVAIALSTLNRGIIAPPQTIEARRHELSSLHHDRRAILVTFVAAYVLYVATESSASGWIASQLHGEGYSVSLGSLVTGGFWLGLSLGRIFGGPLHKRLTDQSLVLGSLIIAIFLVLLAYSGLAAPYVYPLLGVALASVYSMGLIWYTVLCPHDSDGLALIIFCMMSGGIVGPGLESIMVSVFSIHVVPLVIAGLATLTFAVFASARRFAPASLQAPGPRGR
jgi:MFS transporter, FHS family, glucose/mannose:H+ symporter